MKLSDLYTDKKQIYTSHISDIYSAKDVTNNTIVCLKVVDIDFSLPPHDIKREIQLVKRLSPHSRIIEYINDLQILDDIILVTKLYKYNLSELVKLPRYCKRTTKYDFARGTHSYIDRNIIEESHIKQWLKQMSSGLAYIHKSGIIHRDIKPSNIMFANDDITEPIIGDFGISYDVNGVNQDEPLKEQYIDVCTGIFKAPELLLGITDYLYEIDIWSLGIILTILYSPNFESILTKKDNELTNNEIECVISDLHLLSNIFKAFGTPNVDDVNSELYWGELTSKSSHFTKFKITQYDTLDNNQLIPRCNDQEVSSIFRKMIKYDRITRITSDGIFSSLAN
ncbi:Serine/threonine-protein kinase CAK1 [Spathaspora sp. JA1]|nr:Serine/threonine-protein kinase CAK1 [Spathaspora sp. JA1]